MFWKKKDILDQIKALPLEEKRALLAGLRGALEEELPAPAPEPEAMNGKFRELLAAGDIVPARTESGELFELEGTQYYEYKDGGVPTRPMRFHAYAETSFEHEQWTMNRDQMLSYLKMFREFTSNLVRIAYDGEQVEKSASTMLLVATNVEDRVSHYSTIEYVYDMASIIYFTPQEDPTTYDRILAEEKKKLWRRYPYLYSFFLSMDLSRHVPLARLSQRDTLTFAAGKIAEALTSFQHAHSKSELLGLTSDTTNYIGSQMEIQKEYGSYFLYLLKTISTTSAPTNGTTTEG